MGPSVLAAAAPTAIISPFDPYAFMAGSKRSFDAMAYHHEDASISNTRSITHSNDRNHTSSSTSSRSAFDDHDDNVFAAASSAMFQRPAKRKAVSSATTELRQLREEKALLQYELDSLQLKWRRLGIDNDLLACACDAAIAKRDAKRAEAANKQLKAQLLTQQLFFASVHQMMLYDSPLLQLLRAKDAFDAVHTPLQLTGEHPTRKAQLDRHCASALRLAPAVMSRFARAHVVKATTAVPFSHVSVMGDAAHTYVASVFVCKLRNLPIERVYRAALAYADALPDEFQRCLDITMRVDPETSDGSRDPLVRRSLARTQYVNAASGVSVTQRTVLAAQLRDDCGVIVHDFVDEYEGAGDGVALPLSTCSSLVVSPLRDADDDAGEQGVLLQRVVVNRYALPATSRRLHDDVKASLPHLNGDLLMAVVCRELQTLI